MCTNNEHQSLRAICHIARIFRATSPQSRQITRDISHIVSAYELHDKEAALACNRYITTKYPALYSVASRYGLHRMSEEEMCQRTESELQHMLYSLCLFLYDGLKQHEARVVV